MVVRYIKVTFVTIFVLVVGLISTVNIQGAEIAGYPPNLSAWGSQYLYQDYYFMTTNYVEIETGRKVISVFVPDFTNIITSMGENTEQSIIFLDINYNEIKKVPVFGRLTGWFNYVIPDNAFAFKYNVLVGGPLPSNYIYEWNEIAYIGYGDLLDIYQQAWSDAYDYGYDEGVTEGYYIHYDNIFDYGYDDGLIVGYDEGYDEGYGVGYGVGYNDGVATNSDFSFTGLLTQIFLGVGSVLGIELLPNITIGALVAVPIVFGIIYFILGKRSKD